MEWTAVTVLAAIAGLGVTVGGPVVRLNSSITRLTALLQAMERRLDALEAALAAQQSKAAESHRRLWEHNEEQDNKLNDHERRITILEHKKEDIR